MKNQSSIQYAIRQPRRFIRKATASILGQVAPLHQELDFKLDDSLSALLNDTAEKELNFSAKSMYAFGGHLQRERLKQLAQWSVNHFPGDLVEIGAFRGQTSRLFAKIAAEKNRRLIVIDPWISGSQDCAGLEFDDFNKNIEDFKGRVDVWRSSSLDKEIIKRLGKRHLSFAFVDGLHTLEASYSDMIACSHCTGVIAIDDTRYNKDLLFSVCQAASKMGRTAYQNPDFREAYLFA